MKHRIIPSIICDFICGAFLPVDNQPSSIIKYPRNNHIHRHRADSGNETAFDAGIGTGLYLVEECTQISFLVRFLRISVQAFGIRKDGIDKMVILIDKR